MLMMSARLWWARAVRNSESKIVFMLVVWPVRSLDGLLSLTTKNSNYAFYIWVNSTIESRSNGYVNNKNLTLTRSYATFTFLHSRDNNKTISAVPFGYAVDIFLKIQDWSDRLLSFSWKKYPQGWIKQDRIRKCYMLQLVHNLMDRSTNREQDVPTNIRTMRQTDRQRSTKGRMN